MLRTWDRVEGNVRSWGVSYLGDPSLHDQEVRVVHIQLDRSEEVLDSVVLDVASIDEVLVLPSDDDLSGDGDLIVVLVTQGRPRAVL